MRFSVIVTNYNNEKYIGDCLRSILKQTFTDFECIFVDDCSTDHSIFNYNQNANNKCKLLRRNRNGGVGIAHRDGCELAKGEIIVPVHSDDVITLNALEELDKAYKKYPEVNFVYSQFYICNSRLKGKKIGRSQSFDISYLEFCKKLLAEEIKFTPGIGPIRTFKKSLYDKSIGFRAIRKSEDKDICLILEEVGAKFFFLDKPLYLYRRHSESLSKTVVPGFEHVIIAADERRYCREIHNYYGNI